MKNLFIYPLLLCLFTMCYHKEGYYDPEFDKMNFTVDGNKQTITVKSKWINWNIEGLDIDGEWINLDRKSANFKEIEIEGLKFKIDYENETIEYNTIPIRILCDIFEISKPSSKKLIIRLEKNLTQKDRLIKIGVGDGNYFDKIEITQRSN